MSETKITKLFKAELLFLKNGESSEKKEKQHLSFSSGYRRTFYKGALVTFPALKQNTVLNTHNLKERKLIWLTVSSGFSL